MPTSSDYLQLAIGFDAEVERLLATVTSLRRDPPTTGLGGWVVTAAAEARTAIVVGLGEDAARRCSALADECRRRAAVCRTYTEDDAQYRRELAAYDHRVRSAVPGEWVGRRPTPPARPARWAERG